MNTRVQTYPSSSWTRPLIAIAAISALALSLLTIVSPVRASRTVVAVNSGNPTCADFADEYGANWMELKIDPPADGTYGDPDSLQVTITNFHNSSGGTPGSFDWSSNVGVDAVFVKAGSDKHNLYLYDPEATSDTGLEPQSGTGNGISHISFCWDEGGEATPTPTPTPTPVVTPTPTPVVTPTPTPVVTPTPTPVVTPTPTPVVTPTPTPVVTPTPTPVVTPTPTPTPEESVGGSTGTPEQSVEAATGTPAPSVPNTAVEAVGGNMQLPTIVFGLLLIGSLGGLLVLNVKSAIERR